MRNWLVGMAVIVASAAGQAKEPSGVEPVPPDWRILQLQDGVELRYVPLAVTLNDYPKAARKAGVEGTTLLNLQVDTSGLRGCSTARSSGSSLLDEQACRLYLQRGRFDLRGTSQLVTVKAPVRWMLLD